MHQAGHPVLITGIDVYGTMSHQFLSRSNVPTLYGSGFSGDGDV